MASKVKLVCTICDTDAEVPLCCEKGMHIKGGELVCNLCGTEKTVPICCGRSMKNS